MDDSPEVIRQQMEETKIHLTEKLETLEQQVQETVQTTGSAVSATVGAVQETVESVTGAVQEAVHTVGDAFDLRKQFEQHPWWVLGGAVAIGCLAEEYLMGPSKRAQMRLDRTITPYVTEPEAKLPPPQRSQPMAAPAAAPQAPRNSAWSKLQTPVLESVGDMLQQAINRRLPQFLDEITATLLDPITEAAKRATQPAAPARDQTADTEREVYMPTTERFRSSPY